MFPDTVSGGRVDVMVTLWNDRFEADALTLARPL